MYTKNITMTIFCIKFATCISLWIQWIKITGFPFLNYLQMSRQNETWTIALIVCNHCTWYQGLSYVSLPAPTLYISMDFLQQKRLHQTLNFEGCKKIDFFSLISFQNYCEMELGVLKIVAVLVIGMLRNCICIKCK